jgi:hypothetical protein
MAFAQLGGVDVITRGEVLDAAMQARDDLVSNGIPQAIAAKDARIWGAHGPGGLEWLDLPYASRALIPDANQLIAETHHSRLHRIVLLDSGESALAAKTIAAADRVPLTVADGVEPMRISGRSVSLGGDWHPLDQVLVIVSGKHGAPQEIDGHRRALEQAYRAQGMSADEIAKHFLVITDPGSPLVQLAHRGGYRLFICDPAIPEGFGALSAYSLIPAALAGADITRLIQEAAGVRGALSELTDNPGLLLGSILGGCATTTESGLGKDKVAFHYPATLTPFYEWIEHVITASTGKQGRGILPVGSTGWPLLEPCHDMHSISLDSAEAAAMEADSGVTGPLGAQFLVWQYAAAVAAWLLGVNPFAHPDTGQSDAAAAALLRSAGPGSLPVGVPTFTEGAADVYLSKPADETLLGARTLRGVFDGLVRAVPVSGYLSIMSYVDRPAIGSALQPTLVGRTFRPVTCGVGPRCIDATGQYHKGGPGSGVFLVVTADLPDDEPVPGRPYSLAKLRMARAVGDVQALRRRGRPVVWVHLRDAQEGLTQLRRAVRESAPDVEPAPVPGGNGLGTETP